MRKTTFGAKRDKTPNYYRSGIVSRDFCLAMSGMGWLSLVQVTGMLSEKIPPEAKARHAELSKKCGKYITLEEKMMIGCREVVRKRLDTLRGNGFVEKKGVGRDAKYRWIEKNNQPQQDKT